MIASSSEEALNRIIKFYQNKYKEKIAKKDCKVYHHIDEEW